MSKIAADNLRAPTAGVETPMVYPVRGSAKSWMNLNGTGTIAIRDSLNVSSATDNGTGDYTENLTSAHTNANYLGQNSTSYDVSNTYAYPTVATSAAAVVAPTASALRVCATNKDPTYVMVSTVGMLA
jgi:hypothetical protein